MSKSDRTFCNGEWIQIIQLKQLLVCTFSTKEEPTKWLGPLFDSKLTFLSHIKMLQYKCLKALNIYQNVCPVPTGLRIAWFY
jgi:hypothetical protein